MLNHLPIRFSEASQNPWPPLDPPLVLLLLVGLFQQTRRWINVSLTLVQRRSRWTNVKPTLIQRIVSAGMSHWFGRPLHSRHCDVWCCNQSTTSVSDWDACYCGSTYTCSLYNQGKASASEVQHVGDKLHWLSRGQLWHAPSSHHWAQQL